jgi:hypothetical protein
MQVLDVGGAEGKVIRVTLPATYYIGGNTGVAYSFIELPRQPTGAFVQRFRLRFGAGFETAKGGKVGPGIGGWTPTTAPVAPYSSLTAPVSGGNTSPYSFSCRGEWGSDGRIHEICYFPWRANYTAGSTVYGVGRALNIAPHVKGEFFTYERRITPNTAYETDTTRDPRTLVQGVDYLANGIHEVYVDGVLAYQKTDEVFNLYATQNFAGMLSFFRGGGDSTWSATTDGSYFDLAWYELLDAA